MAKRKRRKAGEPESYILKALPGACRDEAAAVQFLEAQRWRGKPKCPHCEGENVYQMRDRRTGERGKRFLWRCRECGRQFTVRIGTVFEDSRIPLRHWCFAFWAACASKKGVSALQISRQCSLSYKSALFMMHRIRWAMSDDADAPRLGGTVEADETYIGGKPPKDPRKRKARYETGRSRDKVPVMAMVSRHGRARAEVMQRTTADELLDKIKKNVHYAAHMMTDDFPGYSRLAWSYGSSHETVRHSAGEYSRGNAHTNTAECFFSLVKRGIYGIFHSVSRLHLHRYMAEFCFRWDTRFMNDGRRVAELVRRAQGKRLVYRG